MLDSAKKVGYLLGLLPSRIERLTVRELVNMHKGYQARLRQYVRPFALQSFITQAMFSKSVMLDTVVESFESFVGLPKED